MRRFVIPALLIGGLAGPAPLFAQEADTSGIDRAKIADLEAQMRDPERQREMALMLRAMTEVMLDMPIAPMARAAAEIAGDRAADIDPDLTLRQMAPESGRVGEEIERNLPRAMDAMGAMADGLATMAPMLQGMAARMREAMPAGVPEAE